jgi:hypothetical protein
MVDKCLRGVQELLLNNRREQRDRVVREGVSKDNTLEGTMRKRDQHQLGH